jgi:hypothetical protein
MNLPTLSASHLQPLVIDRRGSCPMPESSFLQPHSLIQRFADAVETNERGSIDQSGRLRALERMLPSGSGFDSGCKVEYSRCRFSRTGNLRSLAIRCDFHPMDENGYYMGWQHILAIVIPTFDGFDLSVRNVGAPPSRRRSSGILDFVAETVRESLAASMAEYLWRRIENRPYCKRLPFTDDPTETQRRLSPCDWNAAPHYGCDESRFVVASAGEA